MAETTNQEATSLENFNWGTGPEDSFFGIADTGIPTEASSTSATTVLEEVKKDPKIEISKKEGEDDPDEDEEHEFFGDTETKVDPTITGSTDKITDKTNEEAKKTNEYYALATELKDKGILSEGIEIPEDVNEEGLIALQEKEIDTRFEAQIKAWTEEFKNDEEVAAFLRFKKEGGTTAEFLRVYGQEELPSEDKLGEEATQNLILRKYYSEVEGLDEEDIQDRLAWNKENGRTEKYAKKYYNQMKEAQEEEKKELEVLQKDKKVKAELSDKAFKEFVTKATTEADVINEVKLTEKDKKELPDYLSKRTVKTSSTQSITQLQADIQAALKDPNQLILLGKFMKSKMNIKEFETAKATTQAKAIKSKLREAMEGKQPKSTSLAGQSLADLMS